VAAPRQLLRWPRRAALTTEVAVAVEE